MEIQLRQTSKIVLINNIPARIWEGHTAGGVKIHAFITRIAAQEGQDMRQFEEELQKVDAPSVEIEAISLRLIL